MEGYLWGAAAMFIVVFIFAFGIITGFDRIAEDCNRMGVFSRGGVVYECHKK